MHNKLLILRLERHLRLQIDYVMQFITCTNGGLTMGASDWLGIHSLSSQAGGTVAKVGGDAGDLMACSEPPLPSPDAK